jgi:hypothetical protein
MQPPAHTDFDRLDKVQVDDLTPVRTEKQCRIETLLENSERTR